MERQEARDDEAQRQTQHERDETTPPAAIGDVEDAVTPKVEGELTQWRPSEPNADEDSESTGA